MLKNLMIVLIGLELVSTQSTTCNRAIPVTHNGVSSSISYEGLKQALGDVSSTHSDVLDTRCQICGQRGDLDAVPRDCQDVLDLGYRTTGVYMIYPLRATPFKVRCDQTTAGGGWTVIQRRISSSDFYKTWYDYKHGFGDLNGNFWLGNDNIHILTASGNYRLRVDLRAPSGEQRYAEYSTFSVGDDRSKYRLTVSGYSGTAGDSLAANHNGLMFTTKDVDNDAANDANCGVKYYGGWWYYKCHYANLKGLYGSSEYGVGLNWSSWLGWLVSMTQTEMKIRKS